MHFAKAALISSAWACFGCGSSADNPGVGRWVPFEPTFPYNGPVAPGSARWLGSSMIGANPVRVPGGEFQDAGCLPSGCTFVYTYTPASDTWEEIIRPASPGPRDDIVTAATGDRYLLWGGTTDLLNYPKPADCAPSQACRSGYIYNVTERSWSPMTLDGAPSPRIRTATAWTGRSMIVWGGQSVTDPSNRAGRFQLGDGASYDPGTNAWTPLPSEGAPAARERAVGIMAGDVMVVWGGSGGGALLGDGARYNASTSTWSSMSGVLAPGPRASAYAVWTGSEVVIWGGICVEPAEYFGTPCDDGAAYDPVRDSWRALSRRDAPRVHTGASVAWTGKYMIVWGGEASHEGALYDPVADTWQPMATADGPEADRSSEIVWTGSEAIVWGGRLGSFYYVSTGSRFYPPP